MNRKNSLETKAAKMVNGGFARIFLVLLALSLACGLQAQTHKVKIIRDDKIVTKNGRITAECSQPLNNVRIYFPYTPATVSTDGNGLAPVPKDGKKNSYEIKQIRCQDYFLPDSLNIYNKPYAYETGKVNTIRMVSKQRYEDGIKKRTARLEKQIQEFRKRQQQNNTKFQQYEDSIAALNKMIDNVPRDMLEILTTDFSNYTEEELKMQQFFDEGDYDAITANADKVNRQIDLVETAQSKIDSAKQSLFVTLPIMAKSFANKLNFDSATYYYTKSADMFDTNFQVQIEAGLFLNDFACNYDLALKYCNRALHIAEKNNDSLETANSYYHLALVYCELNEYDKALELFNSTEPIWKDVSYGSNDNLARLYNGISKVYFLNNKHYRALEYSIRALMICENASYRDNDNVRLSYLISGMIYLENGDADRGAEYLNKALSVPNATWGDNSLIPAQLYNIIGDAYAQSLKTDKALEYYAKVRNIYETVLPENHTEVINLYIKTGDLYVMQDESDKALEYYNKALHIRKNTFGESDLTVGYSYYQIGLTYADKNEYDKALEYMNKALNVLQSSMIINYSYMAVFYRNLAEIYSASGDTAMAKKYNKKATKIERRLK